MALVARPIISLSYDDSVGNLSNISRHDFSKYLQRKSSILYKDVYGLKTRARGRYQSYAKLDSGSENSHVIKSENSGLISCGLKLNSLPLYAKALIPKIVKVTTVVACTFFIMSSSAEAVNDAVGTYTCLLKECRSELVKCIGNPSCAANIACVETCSNRPDEKECLMRCGDLFQNSAVEEFNSCAVSRKKCVSQVCDSGEYPVPDPGVLVKKFNLADFTGKWYISSGLNPTFDIYDCQVPEFNVEDGKLVGNLNWRVETPYGGFFTRETVQKFVQDPIHPGILYNHGNEYLNYQDEWYILSSKIENQPDDYVFVYYRGSNDAWDGYGGAVVYTRSATVPENIVPQLEKAAQSIGRDFGKFVHTDNTCSMKPPLIKRLEKRVLEDEKLLIAKIAEGFKELQNGQENFVIALIKEMEVLSNSRIEARNVAEVIRRVLPSK